MHRSCQEYKDPHIPSTPKEMEQSDNWKLSLSQEKEPNIYKGKCRAINGHQCSDEPNRRPRFYHGSHHPSAINKTIEVASNIHHINANMMYVDKTLKAIEEKNGIPPSVTTEPSKLTIDFHDNANALGAHSGLVVGTGATRQTIVISSHDCRAPCNLDPSKILRTCPDHQ
ncbi:hypothetical protein R3W88_033012 [Solanum pinnatisectum]|uniref:Uncharacterized protein n=1 Tax=Solanum pinnatisectum TaxID=50273 RepID=A0AAV9K263_9SOLN|nr:hypothetical protein R3W88_033012 [Solanum pinnatisectum]